MQTLLSEFNVNYEKVWANKSFDKELLSTTEKLFNLQEQILKEEQVIETQLNASNASIHHWQNQLIETL